MLVQGLAVEPGECERVLGKVPRDPVHDDADAGLVQAVDEVLEVVGGAEPARGRVVPRDLVAPRTAERVLGERQELDVRVAHLGEIVDERVGGVAVAEPGPPRPEVQLVGRHRLIGGRAAGPRGEPVVVAPRVRRFVDDGCRGRRHLGPRGHRVCLQDPAAVRGEDLVLVGGAGRQTRDEQFPDTGRAEAAHRVRRAVPPVEVADHAHGLRVRRPDGERHARDAREMAHMGAQHVPELFVPALADEVLVDLAERRQMPVRVVAAEVGAAVVGRDELVGRGLVGRLALPHPAAHVCERHVGAVSRHRGDRRRHRPPRADHPRTVRLLVRTEHVVRRVIGATGDGVEDVVGNGAHRRVLTCRMWTGSANASRRTKAS